MLCLEEIRLQKQLVCLINLKILLEYVIKIRVELKGNPDAEVNESSPFRNCCVCGVKVDLREDLQTGGRFLCVDCKEKFCTKLVKIRKNDITNRYVF